MPHVTFVPFTGLRVCNEELADLGMRLPGLADRAAAVAELPALGLLTLAGMLSDGWSCSYHDAVGETDELVARVQAEKPSLVAVSALTASIQAAYQFCLRMRVLQIPVVIGGLHATACPSEAEHFCDAVVVGDGESVWPTVLRDVERGELKSRYQSPEPFDLANARVPRFELLGEKRRPRMTLQTQRGCPLSCDFCGASRLLGRYREKPIANIKQELQAIEKVAPNSTLELADDNTFAGLRDPGELFEVLELAGNRYFTEADWRIGERPEVLDGLARSGCLQVLVGIESLAFHYSGMGAKGVPLERIMDAVAAIQETGVAVNGCFIVGADGETRASLDRLRDFLLASPFAEIQLTLQTPFAGTALYRRLRREGRMLEDRDWSHFTLLDVTYQPDCMSVAELEHAFRALLGDLFSQEAATARRDTRRRVWRGHPRFHQLKAD